MAKPKDRTGQKINFITILGEKGTKRDPRGVSCRLWKAQCICGALITVETGSLTWIRSCGCMNFQKGIGKVKSRQGTSKQHSETSLIRKYQLTAKLKRLEWRLDRKIALELFFGSCYFCGIPPLVPYNIYITKVGNYREGDREWMDKA